MNKTSLFSLRSAAVIITAAVLLLLCACAPAASPQPEASVCATAQTPLAEYFFEGDNARTAGYACGTIRLTQPQNAPQGGYTLYWSDGSAPLEQWDSIAVLSASTPSFSFGSSAAIPYGASALLLEDRNGSRELLPLPDYKLLSAPDVSFASVSDIHLNYTHLGAMKKWTNALKWFRRNNIPFVVSSGDIGQNGSAAEYKKYETCITRAGYTNADILEAMGNHDIPNPEGFLKVTSDGIRSGSEPYYYVLRKDAGRDNLFIMMASEITEIAATSKQDNFSAAQMDWLEELVNRYAGKANIFVVQHAVMRNFGPGDRVNGAYSQPMLFGEEFPQNTRFRNLLSSHPELIVLTGHTHLGFGEGLNFTDEPGCARMIHNSSISQPRSYTSSGSISYDSQGNTTAENGSEAYIAGIGKDGITFFGVDLSRGLYLPKTSYITPVR